MRFTEKDFEEGIVKERRGGESGDVSRSGKLKFVDAWLYKSAVRGMSG